MTGRGPSGAVFPARVLGISLAALLSFAAAPPARAAQVPVVLFDQGHGQRFLAERDGDLDLSRLAAVFREEGAQVRIGRGAVTPAALSGVDVLVVSGPFLPFDAAELAALERFLSGGGRLALMLHIAPSFEGLLGLLGVSAYRGVVGEREDLVAGSPQDFFVTRLGDHPVTKGVGRFAVYGAWGLATAGGDAAVIARTGPAAWIDADRDRTLSAGETPMSVGIAVAGTLGRGRFAVFGDDALFQNRFLMKENLALARNLARWLAAGSI